MAYWCASLFVVVRGGLHAHGRNADTARNQWELDAQLPLIFVPVELNLLLRFFLLLSGFTALHMQLYLNQHELALFCAPWDTAQAVRVLLFNVVGIIGVTLFLRWVHPTTLQERWRDVAIV